MNPDICRFKGGPYDGKMLGVSIWPPPETLELVDGTYLRKSYSQLSEDQLNKHIARGAEYEWSSNDA